MLGGILIGVAALLVVLVVVAATRRAAYRVERGLEIAAPPERVFALLDDLREFSGFMVLFGDLWDVLDPKMKRVFEGPAAGVGQACAWSGRKVGTGRMTIEESVPGQKVVVKLAFVKPMASTAIVTVTVAGAPSGTVVTWSMHGNHNLVGRAAGMFMNMDRLLGMDLDKGLAQLKIVAEGRAVA